MFDKDGNLSKYPYILSKDIDPVEHLKVNKLDVKKLVNSVDPSKSFNLSHAPNENVSCYFKNPFKKTHALHD